MIRVGWLRLALFPCWRRRRRRRCCCCEGINNLFSTNRLVGVREGGWEFYVQNASVDDQFFLIGPQQSKISQLFK